MSKSYFFLVILILFFAGCTLTSDQQAAIDRLNEKADKLESQSQAIQARILDARARFEGGEITSEELMATLSDVRIEAGKLKTTYDEIKTEVEKARDSNTPWWAYATPLLTGLLGVGGAFVRGKKMRTAFGIVSRGADAFRLATSAGDADADLGDMIEREIVKTNLKKSHLSDLHRRSKS